MGDRERTSISKFENIISPEFPSSSSSSKSNWNYYSSFQTSSSIQLFQSCWAGEGGQCNSQKLISGHPKGENKTFIFSGAQSNSLTQKKNKKEERRKRNKLLLFWLGQVAVRPLIVHDSMSLPAPKNIYKWPGSTGGLGVTGNHESKKGSRETRTQKYQ